MNEIFLTAAIFTTIAQWCAPLQQWGVSSGQYTNLRRIDALQSVEACRRMIAVCHLDNKKPFAECLRSMNVGLQ
jgi:hypothetical protein